jgi:hypothetical protein
MDYGFQVKKHRVVFAKTPRRQLFWDGGSINFQSSPTQIQVLWLYGKIEMVSHPNPTISFIKG